MDPRLRRNDTMLLRVNSEDNKVIKLMTLRPLDVAKSGNSVPEIPGFRCAASKLHSEANMFKFHFKIDNLYADSFKIFCLSIEISDRL